MSRRTLTLFLAGSLLAAAAGPPSAKGEGSRDFGAVTLGLTGGFQMWTLPALEDAVRLRAEEVALDGFDVGADSYDLTYAYGVELQVRLTRSWFARAQFDWTRLTLEDRDREFLQFLGGGQRSGVSLSYSTRVQTRPLIGSFGLGHAWQGNAVRLGISGNLVVAPLKVEDKLGVFIETETVSEVTSSGTGLGAELAASLDYYTDARMNLYLELFARTGRVDVTLDDDVWESTILPGTRRVDLGGGGIRVGFRWI